MTQNIKFQNIQVKECKSQNDAFEELCIQIFQYFGTKNGWENDSCFISKNGKGGDAGVEAYWKFDGDKEYAIQAKFFDKLDDPQWKQIDNSVNEALNKHPNLIKYYISIPLNRTDKKIKGKNSQLDKWDSYVRKWKENKNIEFIWWGQTELQSILLEDLDYNSGKIKYWFDKEALTLGFFNSHFKEVEDEAYPRYSSNDPNIETENKKQIIEITKPFNSIFKIMEVFSKLKKNHKSIKEEIHGTPYDKQYVAIETIINKVLVSIYDYLYNPNSYFDSDCTSMLSDVSNSLLEISYSIPVSDKSKNGNSKPSKEDKIKSSIKDFINNLGTIENFILSTNDQAYLLVGSAGQGKTHLLCDVLLESIRDREFIALLVLANYLKSKSLQDSILEKIKGFSDIKELLGALDSYASHKKQFALFIIDGINEWEECKRETILNEVKKLKSLIFEYKNIKLLISCRKEYLQDIFGEDKESEFHFLYHSGFGNNSLAALYSFCEHCNIKPPSAPLLSPDLSNPLILKTLCKAFSNSEFPKGISGIQKIFDICIEEVNNTISKRLDIDKGDTKVQKILEKIARLSYKNDGKSQISIIDVKSAIKDLDDSREWSKTLLFNIEKEGLLVATKNCIYLSYDRYKDYLISNFIIKDLPLLKTKKLNSLLTKTISLLNLTRLRKRLWKVRLVSKINTLNKQYSLSGVVDFLSISIPEKLGFELASLYKNKNKKLMTSSYEEILWDKIIYGFYNSLPQRELHPFVRPLPL